jgi:hypothetical protein
MGPAKLERNDHTISVLQRFHRERDALEHIVVMAGRLACHRLRTCRPNSLPIAIRRLAA